MATDSLQRTQPGDTVWRSFTCAYTARAVFHFLMPPSFVFVAVPDAHVSCLTWRFSFNASKYTDYVIHDNVINGGGCCCLVGANVSVTSRGGYVMLLMAWHQRRVQGRESASRDERSGTGCYCVTWSTSATVSWRLWDNTSNRWEWCPLVNPLYIFVFVYVNLSSLYISHRILSPASGGARSHAIADMLCLFCGLVYDEF